MILIYSPKVTNRLQYVVKFIFSEVCGFEYAVTSSTEEFLNFKGAKINYSNRPVPEDSIQIVPAGLLFEKKVREFAFKKSRIDDLPVIFAHNEKEKNCDLGYDLFSMVFFMISRYEEHLPFMEDKRGRFEADQSFAYQNGFLETPVIDIACKKLKEKILKKFSYLPHKSKTFQFIPTYDIDVAYAYKGRGISRNLLAIGKDFLSFDMFNLKKRLSTIFNRMEDPFDTYDYQIYWQKKLNLNPVYFFLVGDYGAFDKNISIYSPIYIQLCKKLGDYARTGIHPSYTSNYRKEYLKKEIKRLSDILNREIVKSRQHYLKLQLPETYQNLLKNEIREDYTMTFATHTGFRAGTCNPFSFYDLSLETETPLKIFPSALMDASMNFYMKLTIEEAKKKCAEIIDKIISVDGTFISIWHNDALSNTGIWKDWYKVYEYMLGYLKRRDLI